MSIPLVLVEFDEQKNKYILDPFEYSRLLQVSHREMIVRSEEHIENQVLKVENKSLKEENKRLHNLLNKYLGDKKDA